MSSEQDSLKPWEAFYEEKTNPKPEECQDKNIPENINRVCEVHGDNPAFSIILENGLQASLNFNEINSYSSAFAVFLKE